MVGYLSFLKIGPKLLKFLPGGWVVGWVGWADGWVGSWVGGEGAARGASAAPSHPATPGPPPTHAHAHTHAGQKARDLRTWLTTYAYWNQGGEWWVGGWVNGRGGGRHTSSPEATQTSGAGGRVAETCSPTCAPPPPPPPPPTHTRKRKRAWAPPRSLPQASPTLCLCFSTSRERRLAWHPLPPRRRRPPPRRPPPLAACTPPLPGATLPPPQTTCNGGCGRAGGGGWVRVLCG